MSYSISQYSNTRYYIVCTNYSPGDTPPTLGQKTRKERNESFEDDFVTVQLYIHTHAMYIYFIYRLIIVPRGKDSTHLDRPIFTATL